MERSPQTVIEAMYLRKSWGFSFESLVLELVKNTTLSESDARNYVSSLTKNGDFFRVEEIQDKIMYFLLEKRERV